MDRLVLAVCHSDGAAAVQTAPCLVKLLSRLEHLPRATTEVGTKLIPGCVSR